MEAIDGEGVESDSDGEPLVPVKIPRLRLEDRFEEEAAVHRKQKKIKDPKQQQAALQKAYDADVKGNKFVRAGGNNLDKYVKFEPRTMFPKELDFEPGEDDEGADFLWDAEDIDYADEIQEQTKALQAIEAKWKAKS